MPLPSSDPPPSLSLPNYQFATAPDIIRSNQKDVHEVSILSSSLTDLLRRLYGSRFTHKYALETATLANLVYLSLTTLIGNRTLGEEYTDIYQIEVNKTRGDLQRSPTIENRASYILLSVLFPYTLGKALPALRGYIKSLLQQALEENQKTNSKAMSVTRFMQEYILAHVSEITSFGPMHALTLTLFYFSGSYYHLSKRLLGMRYVFSKRLSNIEAESRVGYEVLGILLVVQILLQGSMHVRDIFENVREDSVETGHLTATTRNGVVNYMSRIASTTHTSLPVSDAESLEASRYNLGSSKTMAWIQPDQQRKCTLCLEPMKDPSVTTCGHVFCWTCIHNWVKEKAECPLCRQGVLGQHILPLRG